MPLTFWLATVLGAGLACIRTLSQVALWQRKEYRWDRMASVLFTQENRTLITWPLLLGMLIIDVGWFMVLRQQLVLADAAGWIALIFFMVQAADRIRARGIARPEGTAKAILLAAVSLIVLLLYVRYSFVPVGAVALQWATLLIFIPLLVALSVAIVNFPVAIRKRDIIARAKKLRRGLKLTVVGITGSYGKTSTKYFLEQLLADQPDVAVTAQHRNAVLPVAQDMLQQLTPKTKTYIVEMGAYRRGEIAELCTLTLPKIGVITAIGNQHVSLFGSQENILAAKWELIEALPSGGTAILNYDDFRLRKKAHGLHQKIVWFSVQKDHSTPTFPAHSVVAHSSTIHSQYIACMLSINGTDYPVDIPLASEALFSSAVAAAAAAVTLGVPARQVVAGLSRLKPFPRTMEIKTNTAGSIIIDDSYSANEQGALVAINHLSRFTQPHKIIVLTPLIELGSQGANVHERIGAALASSYATVVVTGSTYYQHLRKGGRAIRPDFALEVIEQPHQLEERLVSLLGPETVVLLEGRLPNVVRNKVLL